LNGRHELAEGVILGSNVDAGRREKEATRNGIFGAHIIVLETQNLQEDLNA
jgi:hypothetical protein